MGLFGPSKIKVTPTAFVKTQLDNIFSTNFVAAEKKGFTRLSEEIAMLQRVRLEKYIKERQNVIYNLFQIAWDRTIPEDIFIEYATIMLDDPRVKEVNTGVYDRALSRAQEAGMDTFGFISRGFLAQIIPDAAAINDAAYPRLYEIYGTDFTKHYMSFEALIKQHKFVK